MKIGIDCDGVIANPFPSWARHYAQAGHSHSGLETFSSPTTWVEPKETCAECFYFVLTDPAITLEADLIKEADEAVAELSKEHQLTFLSSRRLEVEDATLKWLANRYIRNCFKHVYCGVRNKAIAAVVRDLEYVIDDSPHVAEDFVRMRYEFKTANIPDYITPKLLLIDRPYNRDCIVDYRFPELAGPGGAAEFLLSKIHASV